MNGKLALLYVGVAVGLAGLVVSLIPDVAVARDTVGEAGIVSSETVRTNDRDRGPNSVDVSAYPAEIQAAYKVFAASCGRCHPLARAINTDLTAENWKAYIKKMMNKPGSGISPDQGKTIYRFLKYYQARKDAKKPGTRSSRRAG
ncbi:MAG: hypothetical protein B7733_25515 [Myxococcales bacterium FL481]|nr:MAG: hypothetical protein B7733_25515 [Myxococcales bacterium FL481]